MSPRRRVSLTFAVAGSAAALAATAMAGFPTGAAAVARAGGSPIKHVVVLFKRTTASMRRSAPHVTAGNRRAMAISARSSSRAARR